MRDKIFAEYDKLFSERQYRKAFDILEEIIKNPFFLNVDKSEAYNLQGACVIFDPSIDIENESGLFYFYNAILLDKNNVEAHLNVINGFGNSFNNHTNRDLVIKSIEYLNSINYKFNEIEAKILKNAGY